tara:strand:+ start:146 stop:547 length:402 start_codon:yes stop_codon:yes gene_type:complete
MGKKMNKVIISGNLGQKPEIREAKSGVKVGNFSVATNSRVKKGDEWVDHTEWHRVVVFGKEAENCERWLDKGSKVLVEGEIRSRKYEGKDGIERKSFEILSSRVEFLTRPENGTRPSTSQNSSRGYSDDEIPF